MVQKVGQEGDGGREERLQCKLMHPLQAMEPQILYEYSPSRREGLSREGNCLNRPENNCELDVLICDEFWMRTSTAQRIAKRSSRAGVQQTLDVSSQYPFPEVQLLILTGKPLGIRELSRAVTLAS